MATSPDFTILAAPRISEARFIAILRAGGSPATAEGPACYRAFASAGVDPAVALGVFRKESTYGRFGRAPRNRSWGNIRGSSAGYPLDSGNFRIYPSWSAGAADAARLLAIYGRNQIRPGTNTSTVQTFPYVWAPSTDGNAPDAYGDSIARWIQEWSGQAGSSGVGSGSTTVTPPFSGGKATEEETAARIALLKSLGLPTDLAHVITRLEAEVLAEKGYKAARDGWLWKSIVKTWTGKTVADYVQSATVEGEVDLPVISDIQHAVEDLIDSLPGILSGVVVLAAILAVILLALYRLSDS